VKPPIVFIVAGGAGVLIGLAMRGIVRLATMAGTAWWPAADLGLLAGLAVAALWLYRKPLFARARIANVTLPLPTGGTIQVALDPDAKRQLWRLFVEMASRVATRPLAPNEGLISAALGSLYTLFERARADLGTVPADPGVAGDAVPPQVYVLRILNDDLRPCLARWHPYIEAWKTTGLAETAWPLAELCRGDIEATRQRVTERVWQLGDALGVTGLDRILPARPAAVADLASAAALAALEAGLAPPVVLKTGWRIYVEVATRIATQPLPAGAGLLSEALDSLYALYGLIRTELKDMPPLRTSDPPHCVQHLAFELLNVTLRPFLAKWHPALAQFVKTGGSEENWDQADACRGELEVVRQACVAWLSRLAALIGAPAVL
jgi:hypothetical protein